MMSCATRASAETALCLVRVRVRVRVRARARVRARVRVRVRDGVVPARVEGLEGAQQLARRLHLAADVPG